MKKILFVLAVLFSMSASAQTMVYDTTIVKSPMIVIRTNGVKDSLAMPVATTSQNGFMTSEAMTQLAALVAGTPVYPTPNTRTTTSYTLQASDFNKMVVMTNGGATTVVIPGSLPSGWTCRIMQSGGVISFTGATGVSIKSINTQRRTQSVNAVAYITALGNNVYSLSGNIKL